MTDHTDRPDASPTATSRTRSSFLRRTGITSAAVAAILALAGCTAVSTASGDATAASSTTSATSSSSVEAASSTSESSSSEVLALAQAFLETLDEEQQAEVLQEYSFDNASNWSNFPQALLQGGMGGSDSSGRVGIAIGELSDTQLEALTALLEAALGDGENSGYDEVMGILAADDYLAETYGGSDYGSDNYYIAFLGDPSDSGTWELQFGGHHLAVSNTYTDGELVSATPSFRGTEPTGEFTYDSETSDPLSDETDAFAALLDSLSEEELAEAEVDDTDLLLGPGSDGEFPSEAEGVRVGDLTEEQQALVLAAIEEYVSDLPDDVAADYLERYTEELDDTYIAYNGTGDFTEQGDYLRIDGPSVWIEIAMQPGVATSEAHIHSVWRDQTSDYAGLTE